MNMLKLKAISPRAKYKYYEEKIGRTCDNALLDKETGIRHFETTKVNQKWTTDVSEFHIAAS